MSLRSGLGGSPSNNAGAEQPVTKSRRVKAVQSRRSLRAEKLAEGLLGSFKTRKAPPASLTKNIDEIGGPKSPIIAEQKEDELAAQREALINKAVGAGNNMVLGGSPSLMGRRLNNPAAEKPTGMVVDPRKRQSEMRKKMIHGNLEMNTNLANTPTTSTRDINGKETGPDRGGNLVDCTMNMRKYLTDTPPGEKKKGLENSPEKEVDHISSLMGGRLGGGRFNARGGKEVKMPKMKSLSKMFEKSAKIKAKKTKK